MEIDLRQVWCVDWADGALVPCIDPRLAIGIDWEAVVYNKQFRPLLVNRRFEKRKVLVFPALKNTANIDWAAVQALEQEGL